MEVQHSFIRFGDKRRHNGYIEGINNKIKVIKRVSYGYTIFYHFRNRIMHIINNEKFTLKIIDHSKIYRKKRKKQ
ncbi:MAG: transposase [Acholeplasmatales bacterium]|nr:transposase [Acholeplasmatales bacterium]